MGSSGGPTLDGEDDDRLEPILDLEEALEEALGDLDSVSSMEFDASLRLGVPSDSPGSVPPPARMCVVPCLMTQSALHQPRGIGDAHGNNHLQEVRLIVVWTFQILISV